MENEVEIPKTYSDAEKVKAAYALNMCTVSVSQIIDYNDAYILEQEYEAILNNLNLKEIPKDEALLRILTEMLNTITFFRIQELKKAQIEKQYQNRMKNAIWSAVPSASLLVSGNPIVMAVSLATTIGTGYMNYRKEKVAAASEKEKAEMELQITAIEQLNALRRELFTTAWRLADKYEFDDRLRLTEKQITQYNEILTDCDELRKYARLEAVQSKFEAYPPFWYFFGHTASFISQTTQDTETKLYYFEKAKEHFSKYEALNEFNILREDQMTASFALEYIDLLFLDKCRDENKIMRLLDVAVDKAGNNNDILQLCATTCLRLGDRKRAMRLLKMLVNEDYNKVLNAQLLSGLYVCEGNRPEYNVLMTRVSPKYLFPMPSAACCDIDEINERFENQQKSLLKEKFKLTLQGIIDKYTVELNQRISLFDMEGECPPEFFDNSKRAKRERISSARAMFCDEEKTRHYLERMQYVNLPVNYIDIFQRLYKVVFSTDCYNDMVLQDEVVALMRQAISKHRDAVNCFQTAIDAGTFGLREYERLQKLGIVSFVKGAFEKLYQHAARQIDATGLDDLLRIEGNLIRLCEKAEIKEPEIAVEEDVADEFVFESVDNAFDVSMFGTNAIVAKKSSDYIKEMLVYIREQMKLVKVQEPEMQVIYREQVEFERYFGNSVFEAYPSLKPYSIMIVADNTKNKFDLIFTTEGIVYVINDKVRKKVPYEDVKFVKDTLELCGKKYKSEYVDVGALYQIAKGLNKKFINNLEQKIEYIDGEVTAKILNQWFRDRKQAMADDVTRVYAWADQTLLRQMGYVIEKELSKENYLLQFYCELKRGYIFELRVVEFDSIDRAFAAAISKAGILRVER